MKSLFIVFSLLFITANSYANDASVNCFLGSECWVEMSESDNKELFNAINEINTKSRDLIQDEEAEGNVWFRAYKREAKYNTRSLRPKVISESVIRSLLESGNQFFIGSPYQEMLIRYEMDSDFYTDIISVFRSMKYYDNQSLSQPLNFQTYDTDYSDDDEPKKILYFEKELGVIKKFLETQAKADEWNSLVTFEFTQALYNENYEYRPYLLITDKYVISALYRWQL